MADFNDGKWHGWNGGECPVHPKTIVDVRWMSADEGGTRSEAGFFTPPCWEHSHPARDCNRIVAFRVIKEHRGPRDFWIMLPKPGGAYLAPLVHAQEPEPHSGFHTPIHVREVLE